MAAKFSQYAIFPLMLMDFSAIFPFILMDSNVEKYACDPMIFYTFHFQYVCRLDLNIWYKKNKM